VLFAEDQDMIQAVAPQRADQAFNVWILPAILVRSPGPEYPSLGPDW
jgi:hypothetical protein